VQTLPAGAAGDIWAYGDSGFTCTYAAPSLTCTGGNIPAATSATIEVVIPDAPRKSGSYKVSARADSGNAIAERDETNNADTTSFVVAQPDLTVRISPSASSVDDGGVVTYAVTATNVPRSGDASGVTVQVTLPAGATPDLGQIGRTSGGTCAFAAPLLTCPGLFLEGGVYQAGSETIRVPVTMPRINGSGTVTAVVDPASAVAERDEANNTASLTTTIVGRPDLSVSASQSYLVPGLLLRRVVTVRNTGIVSATGVEVVVDAFNDLSGGWHNQDLLQSRGANSGFTCSASRTDTSRPDFQEGDSLRCTGGTIAVGQSATIEVVHLLGVGNNAGRHWTSARVDPNNTISEQDETNNTATAP
jgi:hypothetical protein